MSYMNNQRHKHQFKIWYYYRWSFTGDPERYVIGKYRTKKDWMRKCTEGYKRYIKNRIRR